MFSVRFSGCVPLALVLMMRRPFFSANQWALVTFPLTSDVSIRCIKKPMGQNGSLAKSFSIWLEEGTKASEFPTCNVRCISFVSNARRKTLIDSGEGQSLMCAFEGRIFF